MSLVDGLRSPHTPLRRFLDRELSAGAKPLRDSYRAQHRAAHVLLPPPGVGTEAGPVGTAIDQRRSGVKAKPIGVRARTWYQAAAISMRPLDNSIPIREASSTGAAAVKARRNVKCQAQSLSDCSCQ
ncbi:hypothetical protein OG613_44475 (plasmid) [Streptomyces sp. NBC_00015]|uniref:hypothetical protein n=1 Tax=Streptomyces sp. NBC_00015 TaxID=2903611 RepID=UPI002F911C19